MPRKRNPNGASLEEAKDIYREFHNSEPEVIKLSIDSRTIPEPLIVIGKVIAVEYEPVGDSEREGQTYRHDWGDTGSRKVDTLHYFCTDTTRRAFYLIKGKPSAYPVFNERGVVG
jgi:hypothetical protein